LFEENLKEKKGMIIKRMGEDGACLFRAIGELLY
jgi:OTU domain-containing protein 5